MTIDGRIRALQRARLALADATEGHDFYPRGMTDPICECVLCIARSKVCEAESALSHVYGGPSAGGLP